MRWNSPWGEGYPGWHLECSVMSTKYLGDEFDIHGGGLDLLFPHHECELAQAKGAGKAFARVWMHFNMITLGGEKMSKSKGHFTTLAALFEQYDPSVIRFHLLRSHYRSVLDLSDESLLSSQQGLKRLRDAYAEVVKRADDGETDDSFVEACISFSNAMNDDLNTPRAIAVLFDTAKAVNTQLAGASQTYINAAKSFFDDMLDEVLGLPLGSAAGSSQADTYLLDGLVQLVSEQRQEARQRRDFDTSDALRDKLSELGIQLEDTPDGVRWKLA